MLYGWKENSMLTNCLAACVHLTITVCEIEQDIGRKSSFCHTPLHSTPSLEGFPCADLREILHGLPQMPNVRTRVKILPKSLTLLVTWMTFDGHFMYYKRFHLKNTMYYNIRSQLQRSAIYVSDYFYRYI